MADSVDLDFYLVLADHGITGSKAQGIVEDLRKKGLILKQDSE